MKAVFNIGTEALRLRIEKSKYKISQIELFMNSGSITRTAPAEKQQKVICTWLE